ncbi:MAG: acyl-CoA dehydrogenase family protein [Proteobacteria bacterium]|nr:acyl-CoA dehydrogenase family protein [Pseudomonadota bacterium]MDA1058900.1 acyl-CoA dehydrogenase family protein [Pseudomonadota bacterium]
MVATGNDAAVVGDAVRETARALRRDFSHTAAEIDRTGRDPAENMARIHAAGLTRLLLPQTYGGIASAQALAADLPLVTDILTEISAGESATAQIWSIHLVAARLIFGGALRVGESVRREIAGALLDDGMRLANSAAEGGKRRGEYHTLADSVDGGYRLSGVKLFNTGTVGAAYTITPVRIRGKEDDGVVYLLVAMDADGVRPHNDWDNMGQRATGSGTITFDNVFVPARFCFPMVAGPDGLTGAGSVIGPFFQMLIGATILGMGFGALEAAATFVRDHARPNLPTLNSAADDPVNRLHLGRASAALAAAQALQREASQMVVDAEAGRADRGACAIHMMRSKVTTVAAVLDVTGQLHGLAGGRATSNKYRLDRFWRNARTLSVHDPIDVMAQQIGGFEVDGAPPAPSVGS